MARRIDETLDDIDIVEHVDIRDFVDSGPPEEPGTNGSKAADPETPEPPPASEPARKPLGRNFSKLLAASAISNIGDGVLSAAFPLVVASITRDPVLVAGATVAQTLPWFVLALVSGALVDRMDRRRVMIITDAIRAILIAALGLAVATDAINLPIIYLVAFGLGTAETFFDTSAEAFLPALVSRKQLETANGRIQGVEWVGNAFAGPPLGALLFGITASLPFLFDAGTFLVAAILIALIAGSFKAERTDHRPLREEITSGLRWLFHQKVLRTLAIMAGVTNLFVMGVISIFVLFAQDILQVSDAGYGVLLGTLGVGGLAGAILAPRFIPVIGPGTTIQAVVVLQSALILVFGLNSNPWLAGLMMAIFGFLIVGWNVVSVTLRQTLTPDALRGRVSSAARMVSWGSQPLGAVMGGLIAGAFGLRAPYFVAAAAWLVMAFVTAPIVNNRTIRHAEEHGPTDPPPNGRARHRQRGTYVGSHRNGRRWPR